MKKKARISPYASVLIERQVEGKPELQTAYTGSSLKSGRAFAQALLSAQTDPHVRAVLYQEFAHAQLAVSVSVPIQHESPPSLPADDTF